MILSVPSCILHLAHSGHAAPSADNSQPWAFSWDGTWLYLSYDTPRIQGHGFPPESPATLLAMGGALENIHQAAAEMAQEIDVEPFPDDCPRAHCYAAVTCSNPDSNKPISTESPLLQRHTNRFVYRKDPIETAILETLESESEGSTRALIFTRPQEISAITGLVETASRIRFRTREVHEWLGKSLRFSEKDVKKADGLDVRTLALPPGGALFLRFIRDWKRMQLLNRVGGYRLLARIDARPIAAAPAVVAITGPAGRTHALDAGRLLVRAWTYLNSRGIAVHPYYVVSDQLFRLDEGKIPPDLTEDALALKEESRALLGLGPEEVLYMLLRIGHPTREPPRSRRLPLEAVFTDLTAKEGSRTVS